MLADAAGGAYGIELRNRICALCRSGVLEDEACSTCGDRPDGRVSFDLVGTDGRPIPTFDGMVTGDCAPRMAANTGHIDLPAGPCILRSVRFDGALAVHGQPVEIEVGEGEEQYQLIEVPSEPYGGVGVTVKADDLGWRIEGLIQQTAALDAGLEPGMHLVAIDGIDLDGDLELQEVMQMLVGPRGSEVEITVEGDDGERTLTLDRREITGQQIGLLGGHPG